MSLGSPERLHLLKLSNLTLIERKAISLRFVVGLSAKEVSDRLCLTEQSYQKYQKKIFEKFYMWLRLSNRLIELDEEVNKIANSEK